MTGRGRALLLIAAAALYSGLSLGGRIFYLAAVFACLALLFSLACVLTARYGLRFSCQVSPARVSRGETAQLTLRASCALPLLISPLEITIGTADSPESRLLPLRRGAGEISLSLTARHTGALTAGLQEAACTDILGLFRLPVKQRAGAELLVLPRAFETDPLRMSAGEEGRALPNRLNEDLSSPEDTRAYRPGDPLKRMHWKLTARRRELIVRRFETPAPPDTLVLLDCSAPPALNAPIDADEILTDTLRETALSVAKRQAQGEAPVRLPLYGDENHEFRSERGGDVSALAELLARQPFRDTVPFERVLNLELRRMRRTGATAVITARLDAGVTEGVKHIRRMGPSVRLYYITFTPDAPADKPYVAQLQQSLVEVCYVSPA